MSVCPSATKWVFSHDILKKSFFYRAYGLKQGMKYILKLKGYLPYERNDFENLEENILWWMAVKSFDVIQL